MCLSGGGGVVAVGRKKVLAVTVRAGGGVGGLSVARER